MNRFRRYRSRLLLSLFLSVLAIALGAQAAMAAVALTKISADPYTNTTSAHKTEVEPDSYAYGNTIVAAFQVGRFQDGGGTNAGWSTSTDGGNTWTYGFLPGIVKAAGGQYDRVSDAAVAYDARHNVWLISTLPLSSAGGTVNAVGVMTSRSTDGGLTWSNPVWTYQKTGVDKNWIVCDNWPNSPYYGNCYTEWDDNSRGNLIQMSTSTDGGLTWGPALTTGNSATGIGGQPVVQPNGTVVVPISNANETALLSFRSTNGGASWSSTTTVTTYKTHTVAGSLRTGPLPSAEVDASGKVYVVWQDCRFRTGCKSNDIVMTTTTDGLTYSSVVRIPIDTTSSSVDHFIPGLAVDPATSGSTAHLALAYYYYPSASCTTSTCQLTAGYVSSTNGGSTWSAPTALTGAMKVTWLPNTTQGYMVGDYISTSFVNGTARPVIGVANANSGTTYDVAMYVPATGMAAMSGAALASADGAVAMPAPSAEHAHAENPFVRR